MPEDLSLSNFNYSEFAKTVSSARLQPYEFMSHNNRELALKAYVLNLKLSEAFLTPIDFCEISLRNAIAEVLSNKYGCRWFEHPTFLQSLNKSKKDELCKLVNERQHLTTDDVISNLNFSFWENLLASKYLQTLWTGFIRTVFPYAPQELNESDLLENLKQAATNVRLLRNRIAHHEAIIYKANLGQKYSDCLLIVQYRSQVTYDLLRQVQGVQRILKDRRKLQATVRKYAVNSVLQ